MKCTGGSLPLTRRCLAGWRTSENTSSNHRWCRPPPFEGQEPGQRCGNAGVTGRRKTCTPSLGRAKAQGETIQVGKSTRGSKNATLTTLTFNSGTTARLGPPKGLDPYGSILTSLLEPGRGQSHLRVQIKVDALISGHFPTQRPQEVAWLPEIPAQKFSILKIRTGVWSQPLSLLTPPQPP